MLTNSFRDLVTWEKAIVLTEKIYLLARSLPRQELYGLAAQMQRSAVSIPSNIAEGSRRKGVPEYLYFLRVARGSAAELETQIVLAKRLYPSLETEACSKLLLEVQKMLSAMIKKLGMKIRPRYN